MIQANIGGDDLPKGTCSLTDDMAAYDALPQSLRRKLSRMAVNWNATGVEGIAGVYGVAIADRVLDAAEARVMGAYRQRIGL